jgi:hypothetical protein
VVTVCVASYGHDYQTETALNGGWGWGEEKNYLFLSTIWLNFLQKRNILKPLPLTSVSLAREVPEKHQTDSAAPVLKGSHEVPLFVSLPDSASTYTVTALIRHERSSGSRKSSH